MLLIFTVKGIHLLLIVTIKVTVGNLLLIFTAKVIHLLIATVKGTEDDFLLMVAAKETVGNLS